MRCAPPLRTPLWMVTREPALNELVQYLEEQKRRILEVPDREHCLCFSLRRVAEARASFSRMILAGEQHLHGLCEHLRRHLYVEGQCRLRSVVVGQAPDRPERFTLMQPLSRDELYSQTDLDLGTRMLERMRVDTSGAWRRPSLVANFVEYEPIAGNRYGIYKIISRIKAEEEIWNKVVDELFAIDALVERDKEISHLSRFVKDIFGVKMVVGSEPEARRLQVELESQSWVPSASESGDSFGWHELSFLEVKDYLASSREKASGWRAIKSVARWGGHLFEIQVQPLRNYHHELERFTAESHEEFKAQREALRRRIAERIPLFAFYRDVLQWLFRNPSAPPPQFREVRVELTE